MTKTYEPDSKFVERLEWQLASEYRRANSLKAAPGKVAVPRRMVVVTLVAGVLLAGVAAIKAADYIRDSWRKGLEIARVGTEVQLKKAHLESTREMAARAETLASSGLIREEESQVLKLGVVKAALDLDKSLLNLDEVKASGVAPRDELYAPVLGGRDFVTERLKIQIKDVERDLELLGNRLDRSRQLVELGVVSGEELDRIQAEIAARKTTVDETRKRIDLRKRYVAGEVTAQEVEIGDRMAVAEKNLHQAQTKVDSLMKQMERSEAQEAVGLVSPRETSQLRYALDSAQAELKLAALEVDVLGRIK
jgi:multidrug resistance efflux pump